jgi:hypothetical protein
MHIVDTTKFAIAIVFLVVGLAILARARGSRGFNQTRQAGFLFLVGAIVFGAIGLGYLVIGNGLLG